MDYLEVTIQTASEGIEAVASALTAGGFDRCRSVWCLYAAYRRYICP